MRARAIGVLAVVFTFCGSAVAQSGRLISGATGASTPDNPAERVTSLQGHLALNVAERLLLSENSSERVRGVLRLTSSGQREAVDRLLRALVEGGVVFRDLHARLAAVRGLLPYVSRDAVRQQLAKELVYDTGGTPFPALLRATAAMVLAASGDARAVETLVSAVRQGGVAAEPATHALLAYPPRSLAAFGNGNDGLPAALSELLGRSGDARAIFLLRGTLVQGLVRAAAEAGQEAPDTADDGGASKRARVAAALALARLGDEEQVPVAESWVSSSDPLLQIRGAEVLLASAAKGARQALVPFLSQPKMQRAALVLAERWLGPEFSPALEAGAQVDDDFGRRSIVLLGRLGGARATAVLASFLRDPARAGDAAFALSRAPGKEARRALEITSSDRALSRLLARAGTVRALALDDAPSGLVLHLQTLLDARDPSDRAAGAFGLAALGKIDVRTLLASHDLAVVRAAARASLFVGGDAARACLERLATETDSLTRNALAIAIAATPDAALPVSTSQLEAFAESDEPLAPLALVALGPREQSLEKRRLSRALESGDSVLRAHAAFALALSPLADATSRLVAAWQFEESPAVRRAIVTALAHRKEPQRLFALELAAKLDPDDAVRESARLALLGQLSLPLGHFGAGCAGNAAALGGCYAAWVTLTASSAGNTKELGERASGLLDASGLLLPVVADPDGALIVAGVSAGSATFRLASSSRWYDDPAHGASESEADR